MEFLKVIGGAVIIFWGIGLMFKIGGKLINLLLIVAAVIFLINFFS